MDENRELARALGQPAAMQAATMGKAKLHGFMTDKMQLGIDPDAKVQLDVHFVDAVPMPPE